MHISIMTCRFGFFLKNAQKKVLEIAQKIQYGIPGRLIQHHQRRKNVGQHVGIAQIFFYQINGIFIAHIFGCFQKIGNFVSPPIHPMV